MQVLKYCVVTELKTTKFGNPKSAEDLYWKLRDRGFSVKIIVKEETVSEGVNYGCN